MFWFIYKKKKESSEFLFEEKYRTGNNICDILKGWHFGMEDVSLFENFPSFLN